MSRRLTLWIVLALCVACFGASIVMAWRTPSTDFGFTAGYNRIGVFFRWQGAAALMAVVAFILGGGFPKGSIERRLGRLPIWIFVAEIVAVLGLVLYLNLTKPAPQTEPPNAPLVPTQEPSQ